MSALMEQLNQDLVIHFAFILTALAYFTYDILFLRALAVASSLVGIVYFGLILGRMPILLWQVIFLVINAWRIVHLLRERRSISFSEEEQELFQTIFPRFAPVEFMKLMRVGAWKSGEPGTVLATQDEHVEELLIIYNGEVAVEKDGAEVVRLKDGTWVGEMSYLQGGNASATVRITRPTRYVAWPKDALTKLLKRNPTMDVAMQSVLSADLIQKLGGNTKPGQDESPGPSAAEPGAAEPSSAEPGAG